MRTMSTITYQYRIKDSQHRKYLIHTSWAVNRVWNYCNEVSLLAWRRERKWLTGYDLANLCAGAGKELGLHSDTINEICLQYAKARKQFGKVRLKWRSRKRHLGWIPFKVRAIRLVEGAITYLGRTFRLWLSRDVQGTIKTGSFTQDARGRWYVSVQCDVEDEPQLRLGLDGVGIDLGLADQIACSDMDEPYSRENRTRQYEDALAMAQRAKKKNRVKAIHAKIKNARKDWTHKATTAITRRADFIAVGDASSTKLAKTNMAKSTYDAGWHMVRAHLNYKAIRLGGRCVPVRESFTSVTCSACLQRTGPSGLSGLVVRAWTCSHCGTSHSRDINAAKNILRLGRETPMKGIPSLKGLGGRQRITP
jgi:putative transposase